MEPELEAVTRECLDANIESTDKEVVTEKLLALPFNHFLTLLAIVGRTDRTKEILQLVTTTQVVEVIQSDNVKMNSAPGERAIHELVRDLETMG